LVVFHHKFICFFHIYYLSVFPLRPFVYWSLLSQVFLKSFHLVFKSP
jgi:hypothetical protein